MTAASRYLNLFLFWLFQHSRPEIPLNKCPAMFNMQLVAGNQLKNTPYLLKYPCVRVTEKNPLNVWTIRIAYIKVILNRTDAYPYRKRTKCPPRSCFPPIVRSIIRKKIINYPPRNTVGCRNPRSELSPGKLNSQTKSKIPNVFFKDKNISSKNKTWTHHRCTWTHSFQRYIWLSVGHSADQEMCTWVLAKCWKCWKLTPYWLYF